MLDAGDWTAITGLVSAVLGVVVFWKKLDHQYRMEQLKAQKGESKTEGGA